jgi:hypothetical protein
MARKKKAGPGIRVPPFHSQLLCSLRPASAATTTTATSTTAATAATTTTTTTLRSTSAWL